MSLSAFDDFMNPIVADRLFRCLETLVPILGVFSGDQHQAARSSQVCLAMMLPEAIQRCSYSVSSREADPDRQKSGLTPNQSASPPDQSLGNPAFAEDGS